jgi:hypothetical protein
MRAVIQPVRSELDETTACSKATKTEPDSWMTQSIEEHQEIPKEEATVMPVGGPRKRRRIRNLAAERDRKWGKGCGEKLNPGGSRLPPAWRCPAVQKWHGEKETSSGELGPRKIVSPGREGPYQTGSWPALQEWYSSRRKCGHTMRAEKDWRT